jgi:hypothetical protein
VEVAGGGRAEQIDKQDLAHIHTPINSHEIFIKEERKYDNSKFRVTKARQFVCKSFIKTKSS